ncbi:Uncharacterised protein [Acetobacterium wieringae]|uniref:Ig-like domain-containing protein n=1 Tax=Acetobacterium wieringae TaxID=52694 RepID=UPI001E07060F|nr:Ig-like domain-containing protein [Acetobacterium wieringae]VUZ26858.1 Uncharacterised protein [Acetobacterium wieringae]
MKKKLFILVVVGLLFGLPCSTNVFAEELSSSGNQIVKYQTHVQNIGWQDWVSDGTMSGTSGKGLRLEGICIALDPSLAGSIEYQTHVQNIGWQDFRSDGAMSGTSGLSYRLEAINIRLTGDVSSNYDVYYRTHVQNIGWMGWAKNGQSSGSAGFGYRLEGIEIQLVAKGEAAPGSTSRPFVQEPGLVINVESVSLDKRTDTIVQGGTSTLTATITPSDADNKSIIWSSSDTKIASVDANGKVTARSVGVTTITATSVDGNKTASCVVTVVEPKIQSIDNIVVNVTQNDLYTLPGLVTAKMVDGSTRQVAVSWNPSSASTINIGSFVFSGAVDGYDQSVKLTLNVQEYKPNLNIYNYSAVTINNVCKQLSLNIQNAGSRSVKINRIEIYERGVLVNSYSASQLAESNIATDVSPLSNWGMAIDFKFGIWIDNSYVKYFVESDGKPYEYSVNIE